MKVSEKDVLYGDADVMDLLEYIVGEQGAASVREFAGIRPLRSLVFSGEELSRLNGMTSKRAAMLVAAIRLGREDTVTPPIKCSGPDDSFKLLQDMQHLQQEEMRVVLLNTRCEVLRIVKVAMGASNACGVRLADVFRPAIAANAVRIVLAHNHPSGNPDPSADDFKFTELAKRAGRELGIDVVDHIVIAANGWRQAVQ
jgi:DNA repair protein RadC